MLLTVKDACELHPMALDYSNLSRREDLMALATAIAAKREVKGPEEARAARTLFTRIKNERLG
ncbi:hypothetical protein SBA4_5670005 [Candidatus Sulfopaludibacter sp. SbA4]|nr:hypothetical protein SBA4_5670005 [Candidatus Sulfopaludibacter sp. SbA4]